MQMDKKIEGTEKSINLAIKGYENLEVQIYYFKKYKVLFLDVFGGVSSPQSDGRILQWLKSLEQEVRDYFNDVNLGLVKPIKTIVRKKNIELRCNSINEIRVIYTRENIIKLIEKFL